MNRARKNRANPAPRLCLALTVALATVGLSLAGRLHRAQAASTPPAHAQTPSAVHASPPATLAAAEQQWGTSIKPFLQQNCYKCHANGKHKGGVSLDGYTTLASIQQDHRTWGTIADLLTTKGMPPDDEPQPAPEQTNAVIGWIGQVMELCDCSGPRDPGRVAIHRLNRTEYNNTIRDLVGVADFQPAKDFPIDDAGYGFDNIADVLSMSPLLAEKYLAAAEQVLDKALVTDTTGGPRTRKYDGAALEATGSNAGGDLMSNGEAFARHDFPVDGDYEFRLKAGQDKFGDENAKLVLKLDGQALTTFDVAAPHRAMRVYTHRATKVKAGKHKVAAEYTNNANDRKNPDRKKRGDRNLYVDYVEIEGPFNGGPIPLPETHKQIFFVTPGPGTSEPAAARQILTRFASRAFRRPATSDEVESLMKVYRSALNDGNVYTDSVKVALEAVLVSPQFLYRIEADPPTAGMTTEQLRNAPPHPITDYELATRLSYFLWSSMPDEELERLASQQSLHLASTLDAQVKRMLADPKAQAFVTNFVGQWLETRALDDFKPDRQKFPDFDESLRQSMKKEVELFFQTIVKEDRNVLELLDSKYTFLNERLAKLYGIKGVTGDDFRRVTLADCGEAGTRRGGVLEMAGVLTATAMPTRTSPVKRGKFVLEQILGTPPPPPPPNVPSIDKPEGGPVHGSLRVRLEQHRADPVCASCHIRMDPLGFAMENFSAIGAWRDRDGDFPVDPAGKLPDGTTLNGPSDVKKALLARKTQFVRCLSEKLMTYALGRGVEFYDTCTVRDIAATVERSDYRFSALIGALVKSDAFQKRRPMAELKVEKPVQATQQKASRE